MQVAVHRQGFTLIEVMVGLVILAITFIAFTMGIYRLDQANTYTNDQALAHKACQQVLEAIKGESVDDAVSRNGTTFTIPNLVSADGTELGTIQVVDATEAEADGGLAWVGPVSQQYYVVIDVPHAAGVGGSYASVWTLKSR